VVAIGVTKASSSVECVVERGGRVRVNDQERRGTTKWDERELRRE